MNILKIIIKEEYFNEIASGDKKIEYREVKPFWTSRLYDKEGNPRKYDRILFIAGYNPNVPRMETEYLGVKKVSDEYWTKVGKILSKSNIRKPCKALLSKSLITL